MSQYFPKPRLGIPAHSLRALKEKHLDALNVLVASFLLLGMPACNGDATKPTHNGPQQDADDGNPSDGGEMASDGGIEKEQASAVSSTCTLPADCKPIALPLAMNVCCSETLRCGFDFTPLIFMYEAIKLSGDADHVYPADFDPAKPCLPRSTIFLDYASTTEERVKNENGEDILITPACLGRQIATLYYPGCCMPSGACGLSTHMTADSLKIFVNQADEPFTHLECVSAFELNAQIRESLMSPTAYFPETTGSCDYAEIEGRL